MEIIPKYDIFLRERLKDFADDINLPLNLDDICQFFSDKAMRWIT